VDRSVKSDPLKLEVRFLAYFVMYVILLTSVIVVLGEEKIIFPKFEKFMLLLQ
jgi:hypothetical protein